MSYPTPYVVTYNFARDEADQVAGRSTVKTTEIDIELANVELTVSQICTNLRLLQRSDNALSDSIVTVASLAADAITLIGSAGLVPKGAWVTATAYAVKDLVTSAGASYICVTAHTSGTFATDLAAGKWMVLVAAPSAVVGFVAVGSATPTIAPAAAAADGLALGSGANAAAARAVAIGKARAGGADSVAIGISNATASYGALGANSVAIGKLAKASDTNAAVVGGSACTAGGAQTGVVGGNAVTVNGISSGAVGGNSNTSDANTSALVGGNTNAIDSVSHSSAIVGGDTHAIASSHNAAVMGGSTNLINSCDYAATLGGYNLRVNRPAQVSFGARPGTGSGGQGSLLTCSIQTTNATPALLQVAGVSGSPTVDSGSTVGFEISVVGRRTDVAGEAAMYTFVGVVANNAGTTALLAAATKVVVHESDAAWDCGVTANNATDAIDITVTGAAAKTIEWSAVCRFNEVAVT